MPARADRGAGRAEPRSHRGGRRRRNRFDLSRAQRARQPAGTSPASARRRPGGQGRDRDSTIARHGGGLAGNPEGGRRLRSARPHLSGGPPPPDDRGGGAPVSRDPGGVCRRAAEGRRKADPDRRRWTEHQRPEPGEPGPGRAPGGPRLPALHLGLDRKAQGGLTVAQGPRELLLRGYRPLRHHRGGPGAAVRDRQLRRAHRGDLSLPDVGRDVASARRRDDLLHGTLLALDEAASNHAARSAHCLLARMGARALHDRRDPRPGAPRDHRGWRAGADRRVRRVDEGPGRAQRPLVQHRGAHRVHRGHRRLRG